MFSKNSISGFRDMMANLERRIVKNPGDHNSRFKLGELYIRNGRINEAMLLIHPELHEIVNKGYTVSLNTMKQNNYHRPDFDADIPKIDQCIIALYQHLMINPDLIEEIKLMKEPVFQLVPVFEEGQEANGFSRVLKPVSCIIRAVFYMPWKYNSDVSDTDGKIINWQVAVTEGVPVLPVDSNRYVNEPISDQLEKTTNDYEQRKLSIVNKLQYSLLQLNALSQAGQGIDREFLTVLDQSSRSESLFVAAASWGSSQLCFYPVDPRFVDPDARFRASIVVDL